MKTVTLVWKLRRGSPKFSNISGCSVRLYLAIIFHVKGERLWLLVIERCRLKAVS